VAFDTVDSITKIHIRHNPVQTKPNMPATVQERVVRCIVWLTLLSNFAMARPQGINPKFYSLGANNDVQYLPAVLEPTEGSPSSENQGGPAITRTTPAGGPTAAQDGPALSMPAATTLSKAAAPAPAAPAVTPATPDTPTAGIPATPDTPTAAAPSIQRGGGQEVRFRSWWPG
jgi:hypothetical protein